MILKSFRHLWGVAEPFINVLPEIKEAGYSGIEVKGVRVSGNASFEAAVKKNNFEVISQIHTYGHTVDEHIASFKELIQISLFLNPVLINSQSGKDSWSFEEKKQFTEQALEYEEKAGIAVAHETHRSRITYNPWETRDLLQSYPQLKLCCDFSHWVCVCERIIHSEIEIIKLCADRCIHLHARVGYEQGPQVPDPRAPEYAEQLQAHEAWWEIIWQKQRDKGFQQTTFTPEFGPPAYQHTLPFTNAPVADVWQICDWMKQRETARFCKIIINNKGFT